MHDNSTGPAGPPALRLRRPGLRDPRLLLGLALVAVAVLTSTSLVARAGHTIPVYVATRDLVRGDVVDGPVLAVRDVRLPGDGEVYLRADAELPAGLVVIREVGAGELLPRAAVAESAQLSVRPVAVTPTAALPTGVVAGSLVDLWLVPDGGADASGEGPRELVTGLTVAQVSQPAGGFQIGSGVTVHVLVPVDDLAGVLAALAGDGSVEIVPVAGRQQ